MPRFHNINGNIVQFTKAEETARDTEEVVYEAGKFDRIMEDVRGKRDRLLKKTDFYALQDVTLSEAMTTYRQTLRDLPDGLTTVEEARTVKYPTHPTP